MQLLFSIRQFLAKFLILNFKMSNSVFKNSNLHVPVVRNKLKVLYAIIKRVIILMMHYLPRMKIAPKMFSHYEAMFKHIAPLICHQIKKVISVDFNRYILSTCTSRFTTTAPPRRMIDAFSSNARKMTFGTLLIGRLVVYAYYPSVLAAKFTSSPNKLFAFNNFSRSGMLLKPLSNLTSSSNLSQYRHTLLYNEQSKMSIGGLF